MGTLHGRISTKPRSHPLKLDYFYSSGIYEDWSINELFTHAEGSFSKGKEMESRKAFWSLTVALAMFLDFSVIPLSWIFVGYNRDISLMVGAVFAFILAPLAAWRAIEVFARDGRGGYHLPELQGISTAAKFVALWLNPIGWLIQLTVYLLIKALKCSAFLCLLGAVALSRSEKRRKVPGA